MAELTRDDVDALRHMLGADTHSPGFRNYYAAEGNDATMARLTAAGLVRRSGIRGDLTYWVATDLGKRLVLSARQRREADRG